MNSRMSFGLAIAAISATTSMANAGHVPLTRSHHWDATSFASMRQARSKTASESGSNIGSAPVGGITTVKCYGVGEGDLPGAGPNVLGPPYALGANSMTPRARGVFGRHASWAELRDSRNSGWAGAATTDPGNAPTDNHSISYLRSGNSYIASHFADVLLSAAGSRTATFYRFGMWRRTALNDYPLIEAKAPTGATAPCTSPSDTTEADATTSDTTLSLSDTTLSDTTLSDTTLSDTTPSDPFLPESYPPSWNTPDSPPLDPFFLELPPAESMILDVEEPEVKSREEAFLLESSPSAILEPESIALLAIGLAALMGVRRRRAVD